MREVFGGPTETRSLIAGGVSESDVGVLASRCGEKDSWDGTDEGMGSTAIQRLELHKVTKLVNLP